MNQLFENIKKTLKKNVWLKNTVKYIGKSFKRKYNKYNGVIIPPPEMRLMGDKMVDDKYYFDSAMKEGERFIKKLNVNYNTEVLEIGCSSGRSIIGFIQNGGVAKKYVGFDSLKRNIKWCEKYISGKNGWCKFQYIDLFHVLFNRTGTIMVNENFKLEVPDNSFDLIYLSSVLPNWDDHDIKIFAKDYFRILRHRGKVFVTSFIEENVPDITENPNGYGLKYKYRRSVFQFNKDYFIKIFTDSGFKLNEFEYRNEIDGQSSVYFSKP
jgi:ubiquinone/menaquinone biosynthesis C-methylase UbiE